MAYNAKIKKSDVFTIKNNHKKLNQKNLKLCNDYLL